MKSCGKLCRICETKIGAWPNAIGGEDFEIEQCIKRQMSR